MKKYYETHDSPWKNKTHSDEVRKKLSECAKLRTKEKNHFFGKQHSDETKEKISKSNSKAVLQIDKNLNIVKKWYGSSHIAKTLNYSKRKR